MGAGGFIPFFKGGDLIRKNQKGVMFGRGIVTPPEVPGGLKNDKIWGVVFWGKRGTPPTF